MRFNAAGCAAGKQCLTTVEVHVLGPHSELIGQQATALDHGDFHCITAVGFGASG